MSGKGILSMCLLALAAFSSPAGADPWTQVGAQGHPPWVNVKAERRLRLLGALPAIENDLHTAANGYFKNSGPGLAVGLVLDDGLFYSRGFGYADAQKTKTPDEFTVFRAGSLSKVITGTGLLTLIDDPSMNMSLNDNADKQRYLPELKFVCPDWNQHCNRGSQNLGIKLKHLVSHTSGLADVMEQDHAGVNAWLTDLQKSWLLFHPGDYSSYSGVAVEGVGLIEERVSGQDYVKFIDKHLFEPLNMNRSSMDESTLPAKIRAQKWKYEAKNGSWSFTRYDSIIAGDDQHMILPAGGLATSVGDLSHFIKMWLTADAPEVNGHPLLKQSTINSAATSLFTSTAAGPGYCSGSAGSMDSSNFYYSPCGAARGFGVTWYVGQSPYLQHNGDEPGLSGSNTVIDQPGKMGVTGLVSTEPYPSGTPLPAGLDSRFIDTVVWALLNGAKAADAATSWDGQPLAIAAARVLFLSGKKPKPEDLDAFQDSFVSDHHLTSGNIVSFLTDWQDRVGRCSTFRVRGAANNTEMTANFACDKENFKVVLDVGKNDPHRISWTEVEKDENDPDTPPSTGGTTTAYEKCTEACNVAEGKCMSASHGSGDRQACVKEKQLCMAVCK